MKENRKLRIAFFLSTNLRVGAGIENVFVSYAKNKPDFVELSIIQTNFMNYKRMSEAEYKEIMNNAKIVTLDPFFGKIVKITSQLGDFGLLVNIILNKIAKLLFHNVLRSAFNEYDVIYLGSNILSGLLSSDLCLVGSQHDGLYLHTGSNKIKKLKIKLINSGFLYRNIKGFHIFPAFSEEANLLNSKINFVLPPKGIDLTAYKENKREGSPKFLFVGRLFECKGIIFLVKLWTKNNIDGELHIVGDGPLANWVESMSDGLKIIYHKTVSSEELTNIYIKSDIFLAPTSCDTFSTVISEALMFGCFPIMSELVSENYSNFIISDNAQSLELTADKWLESIQTHIRSIEIIRETSKIRRELAIKLLNSQTISYSFYENLSSIFRHINI